MGRGKVSPQGLRTPLPFRGAEMEKSSHLPQPTQLPWLRVIESPQPGPAGPREGPWHAPSRPWPCALHTSGALADTSVDTVAEVGRVKASWAWPEVGTGGHSGAIFANQRREVTPGPSRPSGPRLAGRPGKQSLTQPRAAGADALWTPAAARRGTGRLAGRRVLPPSRGHGGCANRAGARTKLAQPEATALCLPSPPLPGVQEAGLRGWGAQGQGAPGASQAPGLRGAGRTPVPGQRRTPPPGTPRS